MDAMRFRRKWLAYVAVITLCACVEDVRATSTRVTGDRPLKTRSELDFRIVIPERLQLPSLDAPREPTKKFTSRTVERRRDRLVVTVCMP